MPVCAELLRVRDDRNCDAWAGTREWTSDMAVVAMPSVLPWGAGSGTDKRKEQRRFSGETGTSKSKTYGIKRRERRSYAAQAFNIEREACLTALDSDGAQGTSGRRSTPQRQEKLFARNS